MTEQNADTAVTVSNVKTTALLDPIFESSLTGATGFVAIDRPVKLESLRSATSFFSLLFSSSSCFSHRISVSSYPSYFFSHLKYVAWLIPALR